MAREVQREQDPVKGSLGCVGKGGSCPLKELLQVAGSEGLLT